MLKLLKRGIKLLNDSGVLGYKDCIYTGVIINLIIVALKNTSIIMILANISTFLIVAVLTTMIIGLAAKK